MILTYFSKRPWVILGLCLIVTFLLAMGTDRLTFRGDYRIFFDHDNPQVVEYDHIEAVYGKTDGISIIIAPDDGNVFNPINLDLITYLTKTAWQLPYVSRVESLSNFQNTSVSGDSLKIEDLLPKEIQSETYSKEKLDSIRELALSEPSLVNRLVSKNGNSSQIIITVIIPDNIDQTEATNVLARSVSEAVKAAQNHYPDVTFHISGMAAMTNAFVEVSQEDMGTLMPIMFVVLILVLWVLLRSIFSVISVVVIVVLSIVCTLGLAGWAGLYMSMATANLPIFIITLAVADSVHVLTSTHIGLENGMNRKEAIVQSIKNNLFALTMTSGTTAIGFLTFNMSEVPPIRDLGNMVAMGVVIAYILSIVLLPVLVMILPIGQRRNKQSMTPFDSWTSFVIRNRNVVLLVSSSLIVAVSMLSLNNKVNDIPTEYFDPSVKFRKAADYSDKHLSGVNAIEVVIDSGVENGITNPSFLKNVDEFTEWLRSKEEIRHVYTLSDTFRRLNRDMNGGDREYYKLPSEPEISAQYFLLYEISLPYGFNLYNQVDMEKKSLRMVVSMSNVGSDEIIGMENAIRGWFARSGVEYNVYVGSPSLMFAHIGDRNMRSLLIGTAGALVLISVLIGIFLRSLQAGMVSMLTNLIPIMFGFGIFALYSAQIDLGVSVVACICVGVVVDDTVHFLSRYYGLRRSGVSTEEAIRVTMNKVGRALVVTTAVIVCGFLVLSLSNYTSNSNMGLLTSIIIAFALLMDLMFLPSLLCLVDRKGKESRLYDAPISSSRLEI